MLCSMIGGTRGDGEDEAVVGLGWDRKVGDKGVAAGDGAAIATSIPLVVREVSRVAARVPCEKGSNVCLDRRACKGYGFGAFTVSF